MKTVQRITENLEKLTAELSIEHMISHTLFCFRLFGREKKTIGGLYLSIKQRTFQSGVKESSNWDRSRRGEASAATWPWFEAIMRQLGEGHQSSLVASCPMSSHGQTAAEASTSAAEASTSAAEASTSAAEASTSAAEASYSAAEASTSAAEASTSAAEASTSAAEASYSAAEASTSAAEASYSAAEASTSAAEASTSLLPRPPPLLKKGPPKCPSAVRRSPCPPPAPNHRPKGQECFIPITHPCCDCATGQTSVSAGKEIILIGINGRCNLFLPQIKCPCGKTWSIGLGDLAESGYRPATVHVET
ncbi:hypothetical protein KUCAC02_022109 [Chaenocephalus aceratus]|nr:hypothetical protein KUCAC02_022109 [Chaenocephalus aceratus]